MLILTLSVLSLRLSGSFLRRALDTMRGQSAPGEVVDLDYFLKICGTTEFRLGMIVRVGNVSS